MNEENKLGKDLYDYVATKVDAADAAAKAYADAAKGEINERN